MSRHRRVWWVFVWTDEAIDRYEGEDLLNHSLTRSVMGLGRRWASKIRCDVTSHRVGTNQVFVTDNEPTLKPATALIFPRQRMPDPVGSWAPPGANKKASCK